jgi:hypothetical protein
MDRICCLVGEGFDLGLDLHIFCAGLVGLQGFSVRAVRRILVIFPYQRVRHFLSETVRSFLSEHCI